mgnify:CR=1 FL=1
MMPLPREEVTPPVTNMYFADAISGVRSYVYLWSTKVVYLFDFLTKLKIEFAILFQDMDPHSKQK